MIANYNYIILNIKKLKMQELICYFLRAGTLKQSLSHKSLPRRIYLGSASE